MTHVLVRPDPSWRIGVIGAGAAGLSAADALRRAGYRDVVVLEKSERVGGKCCTVAFDGRTYELGAGAITSGYTNVHSLMREHGVVSSPGLSGLFLDADARTSSYVAPPLRSHAWWKLGVEGVRMATLLAKARRLREPGLDGVAPEMQVSFAEWARTNRVEGVAELIEPWFTGFGYGYFDEVPAAYVLKYAVLFRVPIGELLETGYQGLWERVSYGLDVRTRTGVRAIRRREGRDPVIVETDGPALTFDAIVVTTPLEDALTFLDAEADERTLYGQIRYNDYHVVGVRMDGAPKGRYGFFAANFHRERAGQPVFFYRRWMESDVVLFYTMPSARTPIDASEAAVRETVTRFGGRVRDVVVRHAWRYFPHVTPDAMRGGFFERLESMQGRRRTWIAGESCTFTAVEPVVAYSRALVERWFRRDAWDPSQ